VKAAVGKAVAVKLTAAEKCARKQRARQPARIPPDDPNDTPAALINANGATSPLSAEGRKL